MKILNFLEVDLYPSNLLSTSFFSLVILSQIKFLTFYLKCFESCTI